MDAYGRFDIGQYVYLNGEWMRIIYVSASGAVTLNKAMGKSGVESTVVVCMNRISVTCDGGTLTRLDISYKPKVR